MSTDLRINTAYGLSQALLGVSRAPIVSRRNPTNRDKAEIGQVWVNRTTGITFFLSAIVANVYTWYAAAAAAAAYTAAGLVTAGTGLVATTGAGTPSTRGLHVAADGANITGLVSITGATDITGAFGVTGVQTHTGAVNVTGAIGATTTVTAGTNLIATAGSVAAATTITAGTNLVATAGSVTAGTTMLAGTTITAGTGITATTGNIVATAGNLRSVLGNIIATAGNITATLGDVQLTNGNVTFGTTGTGITFFNAGTLRTGALHLTYTAPAGGNVSVVLGDAIGVNEFVVTDSAVNAQFTVDSDGNATVEGELIIPTATMGVTLPGPVRIMTGAGAPAAGLAVNIGDTYIRTDAGGVAERIYIATAANTWTTVTCAA